MDLTIDSGFFNLVIQAILNMSSSVIWSVLITMLISIIMVCWSLKISPNKIDDYILEIQDIRVGATFLTFGIIMGVISAHYHGVYDTSIYSDLENLIWVATGGIMTVVTATITRIGLFAALAIMNGRPIKGLYAAEIREDQNVSLFLIKLGIYANAALICILPMIM
ncbi:MAG: hypothetical protein ACOCXQ_04695 [Patescibacteria group bacterium]